MLDEIKKELRKKYEPWEIEAQMISEKDAAKATLTVMNRAQERVTDVIMKDNDINPRFKEQVKAVIIYPGGDDESHMMVLYTKSLLHPEQYGNDKTCEKKYLKYFGDGVEQDLLTIHGDKAQIVYDEIISRVYD